VALGGCQRDTDHLRGLPPGAHKVLIELVDANHQSLDKGTVTFVVPNTAGVVP
jgi:Family of unknown function (DUF6130)